MKKNIYIGLFVTCFGCAIYSCFRIYTHIERKLNSLQYQVSELKSDLDVTKNEVAILNEIIATDLVAAKENTKCENILVLGNSITWHIQKADIGWQSEWGMAATCAENDFCHVLARIQDCSVTPCNVAVWEQNLSLSLDSLLSDTIDGYDAILIRLGENVGRVEDFYSALNTLISYCKKHCSRVLITGCFWQDQKKESAIVSAALENNITYIPLFWIDRLYDVHPRVGDLYRSIDGSEYTLKSDFVITHPNDKGMEMIANTIKKYL